MELKAAMLADAARVESGKIYVHGGGWDTLFVAAIPVAHPALSVAVVVELGWNEAFRPIQLGVDLYDEDDGLVIRGNRGVLQLGHPANSAPGMSFVVPWQSTFYGVRFDKEGLFSFRVMAGEEELARLRCRVTRVQMPMLQGAVPMDPSSGEGPLPN